MATLAMRFVAFQMVFQGQMAQLQERGVSTAPLVPDMYG